MLFKKIKKIASQIVLPTEVGLFQLLVFQGGAEVLSEKFKAW